MSVFPLLELCAAAAILVHVLIDPPERWNRPNPEPRPQPPLPEPEINSWKLDALVCVAPDGEELELPLIDGWDADTILRTVAQIEAL